MFVCCECCVLSGRGLCDGLITCPEEFYRLWCVILCDPENSWMRRPWSTVGCRAKKQTNKRSNRWLTLLRVETRRPLIVYVRPLWPIPGESGTSHRSWFKYSWQKTERKPLLCKLSLAFMFTNSFWSNITEDNNGCTGMAPSWVAVIPLSRKNREIEARRFIGWT